jgi:hypothetical protein
MRSGSRPRPVYIYSNACFFLHAGYKKVGKKGFSGLQIQGNRKVFKHECYERKGEAAMFTKMKIREIFSALMLALYAWAAMPVKKMRAKGFVMKVRQVVFAAVVVTVAGTAVTASGWAGTVSVTAKFNVDNYFALYAGNADNLRLIGARDVNSLSANPIASPYNFDVAPGDYIYLAAWSDNGCAQGFLGEFVYETGDKTGHILTDTVSGWEVYLTHHDLDEEDTAPSVSQIKTDIASANWEAVKYSLPYESGPWWDEWRVGISPEADWIWGSELVPGSGYGEYQLFRIAVPSISDDSCTSYSFDDFSDLSQFTLNRSVSAVSNGQHVLRLSNSDIGAGSAFLSEPVILKDNSSFSTSFSFQITDPGGSSIDDDGPGADGFVFVIQAVSDKIVGGAGGDIGYSGIDKSVGIEFDTYYNSDRDDDGNHVGINFNGSMRSEVRRNVTSRMNNGEIWYSWIDYNSRNNLLEVRLSQSSVRPDEAFLSYTVDLSSVSGSPNVYAGFTSGTWGGTGNHDIRSWIFNTCTPDMFEAGTFIVGKTGVVQFDWLYDGGMYQGELGIFSLKGMGSLTPGSTEFIAEAVRRARSGSVEGHLVLSDPTEAARFSGSLGEPKNWNSGEYQNVRSFEMRPGDQFATILVPDSTFAALAADPDTTDSHKRPLFSLVSPNPAYGMYLGQIADVNGMGTAFSYEDMSADTSDRDYNDLIIQIFGATVQDVPSMDSLRGGTARAKRESSDWRTDTELGRTIIEHLDAQAVSPETVWLSADVNFPADITVYSPDGEAFGTAGGHIAGASAGTDIDGYRFVKLPSLETGEYRIVLRSADEQSGLLTVRKHQGTDEVLSETGETVTVEAHGTVKAEVAVSDTGVESGVEIGNAAEGARHDFNGDGVINDDDIEITAELWNKCKGDAGYDPFFDLDDDGCITVLDIMKVGN